MSSLLRWLIIVYAACLLLLGVAQAEDFTGAEASPSELISTEVDRAVAGETMRNAITQALISQGLLARGEMHIQEMLDRTGDDVGFESVYAMAESVEFCSAQLTNLMTQADPRNIVHCPYTIAYYTLKAAPDQTVVLYKIPALWGDAESIALAKSEIVAMFERLMEEAAFYFE